MSKFLPIVCNMTADLERTLTLQIQHILETHTTEPLQKCLAHIANKLALQPIELAATLPYLDATAISACQQLSGIIKPPDNPVVPRPEQTKLIRYRIEIGQQHHVSSEEIKNLLVDESGVDKNQIGRVEIRSNYSLIDLPSGMPPDIFLLLQTVELKQQTLKIKRVNMTRKRPWQRRKSSLQNTPIERDTN